MPCSIPLMKHRLIKCLLLESKMTLHVNSTNQIGTTQSHGHIKATSDNLVLRKVLHHIDLTTLTCPYTVMKAAPLSCHLNIYCMFQGTDNQITPDPPYVFRSVGFSLLTCTFQIAICLCISKDLVLNLISMLLQSCVLFL